MIEDDLNVDILARTIYGEARGESLTGMEAVASVVLNRVRYAEKKGGYWWGNTVAEVCKKTWQFSCWNDNDPNSKIIKKVEDDDEVFEICKRVAMRAVAGLIEDETNGATHYHTKRVEPHWSKSRIPCAEIGAHLFYNDIE